MDVITVKYTGGRAFRDRTALRLVWEPGDVKIVTPGMAQSLTRLAEFEVIEGDEPSDREAAILEMQVAEAKASEESDESIEHDMLLTVDGWDKDQLNAYAQQYGVKLDNRKSVGNLRLEVAGIVSQFGAM